MHKVIIQLPFIPDENSDTYTSRCIRGEYVGTQFQLFEEPLLKIIVKGKLKFYSRKSVTFVDEYPPENRITIPSDDFFIQSNKRKFVQ